MRFIGLCLSLLLLPFSGHAAEQTQLQLDRTNPHNQTLGELVFKGAVIIPSAPVRVGGLSALVVSKSQQELLALSDFGRLYRLQLKWSPEWQLVAAVPDAGQMLLDENGKAPPTRKRFDSESFVKVADGWLVGYERDHRIEQYQGSNFPEGTPHPLPMPAGLAALPRNSGLEALGAWPDGHILGVAEAALADGTHPAYLWTENAWRPLAFRGADGFNPSDLTMLPNGDVLLLERGFNLFYGFRARLVYIKKNDIFSQKIFSGREIAVFESPYLTENFEGIAVEPIGTEKHDRIRLYVVSDNNMNAGQETILAAFELMLP